MVQHSPGVDDVEPAERRDEAFVQDGTLLDGPATTRGEPVASTADQEGVATVLAVEGVDRQRVTTDVLR